MKQAGFLVSAGAQWRFAVMSAGNAPFKALAQELLKPDTVPNGPAA